ncbi:MAG: hypothetical protein F6K39_17305 [Okeania sp. SIO3B3]|nr:hypothetical protein [Okeania sp. SIO3B3]
MSVFWWKELHKASILGRLWQKNQGAIFRTVSSIISCSVKYLYFGRGKAEGRRQLC